VRKSLQLRDIAVGARTRRPAHQSPADTDSWSLEVADGEVLAVGGPPGFGGTTLARLVAGVVRPSAGTVLINGVDVMDIPPARLPVGLVPAGAGLLPHLSVEENVTYGVRLTGQPNAVIRHRLDAVAERLELLPWFGLLPHEISPGQRFRAALARASMKSPHVFVVDATAGADGVVGLRQLIERAFSAPALSVLVCTYRPEIIDEADRLYVRLRGRTGPSGPIAVLRAAPPDLDTARLVLRGPVVELDGVVSGRLVDFAGMRIPAPDGLREGQRVIVVTSDALELEPPDQGLPGRIIAADPAGAAMRVLVEPTVLPGLRWPARQTDVDRSRPGDRVGVNVAAERVFVFEPQTPHNLLWAPPPQDRS
jgi:ABC-type sugar transport system ATPase subunit